MKKHLSLLLLFTLLSSNMVLAQRVDTISTYKLNEAERDSILKSYYYETNKETQKLYKQYIDFYDNDIFNYENLNYLFGVLNSDDIDYKIKQKLLITKLNHDKKNPYHYGNNSRINRKYINSKKIAIKEYIDLKVNFHQLCLNSVRLDDSYETLVSNSEEKRIKAIKKMDIKKMELLLDGTASAIWGSRCRYGVINIYWTPTEEEERARKKIKVYKYELPPILNEDE